MDIRAENKKEYQKKWIRERREKYMKQMGPCMFCGGNDEIEIHHVDPSAKESHKIWSWSEDRIKMELKQCVPMCKECHSKFHALLRRKPLIHGTSLAYQRYHCRCSICVQWNRERKMKPALRN